MSSPPRPSGAHPAAAPDAPPPGVPRAVPFVVAAVVLAAAQVSVAAGAYLPFLSPLVGFVACVAVPLFLVYHLLGRWGWWEGGERTVVAVAVTLLVLMLAGLADNFLLPVVGISRPLATGPVLVTGDLVDVVLAAATWRSIPTRLGGGVLPLAGWRARLCVGAGLLCVPLAAMGAVRLNNGAGPFLTMFTLALVMATLAGLFRWRDEVDSVVAPLTLYSVALALLFMTSLRGWFTTGHDVQHEMLTFLNTAQHARWSTAVHDGYNACLSLTILPTIILRWTRVSDPYVFKVFFQVLYAACPLAVYYIGRRVTNNAIALISAVYFVGFVGFLQDMPMLNRQEIGFIFFGSAALVLFMTEHSRRWRWTAFCVLSVGMVLSHYSTTYFAIGALVAALCARPVVRRLLPRLVPARRAAEADREPREGRAGLLGWPIALFLVAVTVVWNGPVNHSGGALVSEMSSAVHSALGHKGNRAAETGYSLAGTGRGATQAQALGSLVSAERGIRTHHPGAFIPAPAPSARLTPQAPADLMPATSVGRALTGSTKGANDINRLWRTLTAWGLQALLGVGLLAVLVRRRYATGVRPDALLLGLGLAALLVVQVVLPAVSLDYGVGRSFMQALMLLGPFVAIGSVALAVGPLRRWRLGLAFAVSLGFFASTSGLVPQLLGGYGPQLHLNNAGDYYDRFLLHPQEVASIQWLQSSVVDGSARYPDIQVDQDLFNKARSLGGLKAYDDIYPSDIRKDAYVVLSYPNVVNDKFETTVDGYELWLRYPTGVLDDSKSLIYSDGASDIYR